MARIIVVDDDRMLLKVVARALEAAGHSTLRCEDGRKAIECLAHEEVDLLITDILMPELDGIEMIRSARELRPRLPILAISGGGSFYPGDYLGIARAFGATAVLPKPFLPAALIRIVEKILGTVEPTN
jgi:CheY-like chemotaxis protein